MLILNLPNRAHWQSHPPAENQSGHGKMLFEGWVGCLCRACFKPPMEDIFAPKDFEKEDAPSDRVNPEGR
jgi:hypothetical protein